jgi:hypothetical protein
MLDATITQPKYWNGSQVSYWTFLFITIFPLTGMLGIDHLLLRSPLTALLKVLSSFISFFLFFIPPALLPFFIPLSFFWYFYDIAQACGESELIKKYGIGIPYYGPTGIGAGIFTGDPSIKESPKDNQRPWLFIAYALATFLSFSFPINKFIIGDYEGGFFYLFLFIIVIGIPIVIIQGIYDIYNLIFDTKTIFETGFARIPGVAFLFKDYYTYTALGPKKQCSDNCDASPANEAFVTATIPLQTAIAGAKVASAGATLASKAATIGTKSLELAQPVIDNVKASAESAIKHAPEYYAAAKDVAEKGAAVIAKGATGVATGAALAAGRDLGLDIDPKLGLQEAVNKVTEVLPEKTGEALYGVGSKVANVATGQQRAVLSAASAAGDIGNTISAVSNELQDPKTIHALLTGLPPPNKLTQGGGALASMTPSIPVLLFSVGLLAFSGYVFYVFRNTYSKPEKSDDPPRESRAVRKSAEREQQES